MKSKSLIKIALSITCLIVLFSSCTSPKAYQKTYINDAEMQLSPRKAEKFEMNFQSYREGASGVNGGKTGGGCGCN
jgi:hypothetical protein